MEQSRQTALPPAPTRMKKPGIISNLFLPAINCKKFWINIIVFMSVLKTSEYGCPINPKDSESHPTWIRFDGAEDWNCLSNYQIDLYLLSSFVVIFFSHKPV